jgi:tetrahydromethanopterin S-methyltransferase subunit C
VEGQPFFITIAGLSVSLAGFGAVIAWLRDDPSGWDQVNLWRVKTIVRHALTIAFLCLTLVPIHTFTQDDMTTLRIGSALAALFVISDMWQVRHPDPVVWDPVSLRIYVTINVALALLAIANIVWASLGLLQGLVLFFLTSPAAIFSNFVREMGSRSGSIGEPNPGE